MATKKPSAKYVWSLASEYNRRKEVDGDGYGICISCDKGLHWKEGDAGHFIPKSRGEAIRYEPNNIWLQCRRCNRPHHSGGSEAVKIEYTMRLTEKLGINEINRLRAMSRTIHKKTTFELAYWKDYYREKLKEINQDETS